MGNKAVEGPCTDNKVNAALAAGAILMDCRADDVFAKGHPEGAVNVPYYARDDDATLGKLPEDKSKPIVCFCEKGIMCKKSVEWLQELGFETVMNGGKYIAPPGLKGKTLVIEKD